jgi:hypothetical protein
MGCVPLPCEFSGRIGTSQSQLQNRWCREYRRDGARLKYHTTEARSLALANATGQKDAVATSQLVNFAADKTLDDELSMRPLQLDPQVQLVHHTHW